MIKSRNEPCNIKQVLEVLSAIRKESEIEISLETTKNALKLINVE